MLNYVIIVLFSLLISGYYNYRSRPEVSASRRLLLFVLRFISLSILLLLLFSPIFYFTRHQQLDPVLMVLTDDSASMELMHGKLSKADALKPALSTLASKYDKAGYKVISRRFANGLEGDKNSTLLAKTLTDLSKEKEIKNLAGILIGSDGWLQDQSLAAVSNLGLPLIVLADSTINPTPDLAVDKVNANRYAWRNEPNTIRAEFTSEHYSGAAVAKLFIAGRPMGSQTLQLTAGQTSSLDFTHRFTQTGFYPWRVEITPLANESNLNNNSYPGAVEVLSDKQRIALISDKPAWDNKFLLDAIASNPRWAVESYLCRDGRLTGKNNQPARLDAENVSAWVIVNNGSLKLDAASSGSIVNSVKQGTGLLFQGLPTPDLTSVLPIQRSNVITAYQGFINTTAAAANYPMLEPLTAQIQNIPPLDYYYVTAITGTDILANMNNPQSSPAIVAGSNAGMRTLGFATLNLWRWQMQSAQGDYNKLISNCITWLTTRTRGSFSAIYNNSYFLGEEIRIRLRVEDDIHQARLDTNPLIRIKNAQGKEVASDYLTRSNDEYSFGTFLQEPGTYSFEISDKNTKQSTKGRFILSESSLEMRDFGYNLPLLGWLANETGGKLLFLSQVDKYQPLPAQKASLISRHEIAIYKKWWVLTIFILAFCLELYFRRRWGLL